MSATVADESITLAKLAHADANTVLVRDANSAGDPSFKEVTNTQILIGDGTGFTAAALSGDVTMTNAGVVSVANNKIGNDELKQDDDITLQSLTTTGTISGSFTSTGSFGHIIADDIKATLPTGEDLSVVILDADGFLKTDEVDAKIFDAIVGAAGGSTFGDSHDNKFVFVYEGGINTLADNSNLKNISGGVEVTGNISSSAAGTGSFGHIMKGGVNFDTAVSTSAAAAGFGSGGGGGGSMNNFTLTADGGSNQTIADGNTLDIAGGDGITTAVGATDTVTVNVDASQDGHISSILTTDLKLGEDAQTKIDFETVNEIHFDVNNSELVNMTDGQVGVHGAISASGNVQVNQITASSFQFVGSGTAELEVQGNITGSNISASGHVKTSQINTKVGELTGSYGTLHGAFNINYGNGDSFSSSLASAGDGYGEILSHLSINASVSAGDVVHHSGGDWRVTDATTNTMTKLLGVALAGGVGTPGPVLIRGVVRLAAGHIADTSGQNGDPLYGSPTTGHVQFAVPGTTDFARIVGYCMDEENDIIYFNPSSTYVEVSS